MSSYKGCFLTTNPSVNGFIFSEKVLEKILKDQPTLPILVNFQGEPIGNTKSFEMDTEGRLLVSFEIHNEEVKPVGSYIVPRGFFKESDIQKDNGVIIINRFSFTDASIVQYSEDKTLTKIKEE